MPFSFINTVASWMLKKRMHQIELFVKYPIDVQNEELKKLVQQAKNTEFSIDHEIDKKLMVSVAPSGYLKRER